MYAPRADLQKNTATPLARWLSLALSVMVVAIGAVVVLGGDRATGSIEAIDVRVTWTNPAIGAQGSPSADPLPFRGVFDQAIVGGSSVRLDVSGLETAERYRAGDVAYRSQNGSIYIVVVDGNAVPVDGDLFIVGTVDDSKALTRCVNGCMLRFDDTSATGPR